MGANRKTVLVAGATSAIGEATVRGYAAAGVNAVTTGRDVQRGEQPARSLSRDGRHARFVRADVAKIEDVERTADEIAAAALFHGRDEASSLNGAVRAADGGRTVI